MEIYTNDLVEIAIKYAANIGDKINYSGYVIEDECCNLQREIRKILYERLSVEFNNIIEKEKNSDISRSYLLYEKGGLKDQLFKTINDL